MNELEENVKIINRYSDSLKLRIVDEIESGKLSVSDAMEHYGIKHRRTINHWVRKLGTSRRPTQVVRVIMKSEQERIRELEKALADAQLENYAMKHLVAVWEEDYGEDIKKKLNTEQLKEVEELKKKAGIA